METVGSLMDELSKYPKEMEVHFWASETERLLVDSIYESNKIKNKHQHLNFDMEFE